MNKHLKNKISCISGGLKSIPEQCRDGCGTEKSKHPCYSKEASNRYARIHLPVAPKCNINCNYCSRKYDCANESRPGVTSQVISPEEAVERVMELKRKLPELSVVGIAGPGDALANKEKTFKTLELIHKRVPGMIPCLSTNGLVLKENLSELKALKVKHVTVTLNAVDPYVGSKIYSFVQDKGTLLEGEKAAELLISRQLDGIGKLSEVGVLCKVNSVILPGVNDYHLPEVSKIINKLGAFVHNMIPYIPAEGAVFFERRLSRPTSLEVKKLNELCGGDMKMMRHCRQCRADAAGFLDEKENEDISLPEAVNF